MKTKLLVLIAFGVGNLLAAPSTDNFPPSDSAPGGLTPAQCPQFISFGFDDNGFYDGVNWIADSVCSRVNPAGNGNPATFDGKSVRAAFYLVGGYGNSADSVFEWEPDSALASWQRIYQMGNEVGNHTYDHNQDKLGSLDQAGWATEIHSCDSVLINMVGVPKNEIYGFRTPALNYTAGTIDAAYADNILYDCSHEEFRDFVCTATYDTMYPYTWPYTLDNGTTTGRNNSLGTAIGPHAGMWELPVEDFQLPAAWMSVTGLDYNIWCTTCNTGGKTAADFLTDLERTLSIHLKSNRSPMFIGMHSDWYSQYNTDANTHANVSWQDRRAAVIQFIDWALQQDPGIRIVRPIDIINWMKKPVALGATPIVSQTATPKIEKQLSANIIGNNIQIRAPFSGSEHIVLFSMSGQKISDLGNVNLLKGNNSIATPSNLAAGSYVLKMSGINNAVLRLPHE